MGISKDDIVVILQETGELTATGLQEHLRLMVETQTDLKSVKFNEQYEVVYLPVIQNKTLTSLRYLGHGSKLCNPDTEWWVNHKLLNICSLQSKVKIDYFLPIPG